MSEDGTRIHCVVCLWRYVEPAHHYAPRWELADTYATDDCFRRLDGKPHSSRRPWDDWLFGRTKGPGDDPTPVMGRAATAWTFDDGVRLLGLHPPEWHAWLAVGFGEKLARLPNWWEFVAGGHGVYAGTAEAARKAVPG